MSFSNENQLISTPSYTHTLIVKKAKLFVTKIKSFIIPKWSNFWENFSFVFRFRHKTREAASKIEIFHNTNFDIWFMF